MVSHDAAAARRPGYPPAPVDPGALAEALRPFGESRMLPPAAYTDPAVFEWERRHFFGGGWTCVALGSQLPSAGSQLAAGPGAGGVLLARGPDGVVRAFANTCRHRGHELLPCGSAATARAIVCPYHSWVYSLSGETVRPDFDPGYAVDFWDLTNRQDWAACESVQRGLSSPFSSPGPLAPDEDAVYAFVTTVARGYLGERIAARLLRDSVPRNSRAGADEANLLGVLSEA